jgi:hypothetical protein
MDRDQLAAAPELDQDALRRLVAGDRNQVLFRIPRVNLFDHELYGAFAHVIARRGAVLQGQISQTPVARRLANLKVRGGFKPVPADLYLAVKADFSPSELDVPATDVFAYDVGATVHARYPDLAGLPRGKEVCFPLVSYITPVDAFGGALYQGTKLRQHYNTRSSLDKASEASLIESQNTWAAVVQDGLHRPFVSAGGPNTGRRR